MGLALVSMLQIVSVHLANYFQLQNVVELSHRQTGLLRVDSDMDSTGPKGAWYQFSPMPVARSVRAECTASLRATESPG